MVNERQRYELICPNSPECIILEEIYSDRPMDLVNIRLHIVLSNRTVIIHSDDVDGMLSKIRNMMEAVGKWSNEYNWIWKPAHPRSSETVKIAGGTSSSIAAMSIMRSAKGGVLLSFNDCTQLGSIRISDDTYPHYDLHINLKDMFNNLANALSDIHLTLTNP